MDLFTSFFGRTSQSPATRWQRPVEMLEDRRLLSVAGGTVTSGPIVVSPPIVVLPIASQVTGLTIAAMDNVKFSGPVAVWATTIPLPTAASGLQANASIQWGDGTSSAGTFVQDGKGLIQINGSHTYTKPGTYATLINVTETPIPKPGGPLPQFIVEVGQGTGKAVVTGQKYGSVTIYAKVNQPFTQTVADLKFRVPAKQGISQYAASIDWGDGTSSAGTFSNPSATGNSDVVGSHTYKKSGTFNIHVVVTLGPAPGSGAEFPTIIVATIDSTAIVAKPIIGLDGTITGTYKLAPVVPDIGATYVFTGTGTAGPLGPVAAQGSVSLPGFIATGQATGTLTLTSISASPVAGGGSVTLKLTGPTEKGFGPFPTTLSFVITGGTGAYANVTGSGTISVTLDTKDQAFAFVIHSLLPPVV